MSEPHPLAHDDQYEIWAHEILVALSSCGFIVSDPDYKDVVNMHQVVKDEIRSIFATVFPGQDQ